MVNIHENRGEVKTDARMDATRPRRENPPVCG
jgi:hypothetical protein